MASKTKDCPSCGGMQEFRPLTELEKELVRTLKGKQYVDDYWRCARPGCLRFQRWNDKGDGGYL
ncbi:hypothetical protein ACIBKX_05065 [Streptomyces sp. NPDC050658]|uniref:hypothetical protein n=1 Tax=unclassified Streptomyces TaxID=2593676 RepID=UPI00342B7424